jgi:hypothetical protein
MNSLSHATPEKSRHDCLAIHRFRDSDTSWFQSHCGRLPEASHGAFRRYSDFTRDPCNHIGCIRNGWTTISVDASANVVDRVITYTMDSPGASSCPTRLEVLCSSVGMSGWESVSLFKPNRLGDDSVGSHIPCFQTDPFFSAQVESCLQGLIPEGLSAFQIDTFAKHLFSIP